MRLLKTFVATVLALFICLPASAFAADSKLVVIPMGKTGSARMTKPLLKHVILPLGAKQTLVPYGQYRRTAKKAKVKLSKLANKKAVDTVAKGMGITLRWGGDWDRDFQVNDNKFDDFPHFEIRDE